MMHHDSKKFCCILLGMGGPDKLSDIPEFLYNIFSDRSIIRLPGGKPLQKPLAWFISRMRKKKVIEHYRLIGGASPLLKWTESQGKNLEDIFKPAFPEFKCYIGMRYFRPTIEAAVKQAFHDGFRSIVFLPLYPQYCRATTGSSFQEARKAIDKFPDLKALFIDDFHDNTAYARLLSEYIDKNIEDDETVLFSAHSIPQKFVDDGDPYVGQVRKTAALAAVGREYHLSFQSRTGPVKWVGPDTIEETKRLINRENKKVFIVPISFVSDHIETLYEIDIELRGLLGDAGCTHLRRMPMFNDDRKFTAVLAELINNKIVNNDGT